MRADARHRAFINHALNVLRYPSKRKKDSITSQSVVNEAQLEYGSVDRKWDNQLERDASLILVAE